MKQLVKRKLLRVTTEFKEYVEFFNNGDVEIAVYYFRKEYFTG